MALDSVANFVQVQASTGYNAAATSIVLQAGQGSRLPAPSFNLIWWNSTDYPNPANDPNVEIVRVTGVATDTLTITRAQESTSASTKNTGGKTYSLVLGITAKMITDIGAAIPSGTSVYDEAVSGSGTSFTLAHTPVAGTLRVYGSGQRLVGGGVDYTLSGTTITTVNSYSTAQIRADYNY